MPAIIAIIIGLVAGMSAMIIINLYRYVLKIMNEGF